MDQSIEPPRYDQIYKFSINLHGKEIQFLSKPGIPDWDQVSPSIHLISEHVKIASNDTILYLGCGIGLGVVGLKSPAPGVKIYVADISSINLDLCSRNLTINNIENYCVVDGINLKEDLKNKFDIVIVDLPKGRRLAHRWLVQAWDGLRKGGILYLCGSNDQGIRSVLEDTQRLFGHPAILGYKKGNRIARFVKTHVEPVIPDWALLPGIYPDTWYVFKADLLGNCLNLHSLPGIFSYDRIDPGTRLLLESVEISHGSRVLDLGCGYGIIGLIAGLSGADRVDLIDTNLLAVAATQKNILAGQLSNAVCFPSDALQAIKDRTYSLILSNPPFHSGKYVDYAMARAFIQQSWNHLEPTGRFVLVANQFIRYDQLMKPIFQKVEEISKNQSFRVWSGSK